MKNVFCVITGRLDKAEERISELESMSIDTFQIKVQREKKNEKQKEQ